MFEREDWKLFRNIETLCQKAGVNRNNIPRLIVKELVDNALDVSLTCDIGLLDNKNGFYVRDYGNGIDETILKDLFSINRPMITSKLLRLPTRGALGNGLRVVTGAVVATSGYIYVSTKGKKYEIISLDDGSAKAEFIGTSGVADGTKIEILIGDSFNISNKTLSWGNSAILMAKGENFKCKTSPLWYTSESFYELVNAYNSNIINLLLLFEGTNKNKLIEAFSAKIDLYRNANSFSFEETEDILGILRSNSLFKYVKHAKLGYISDVFGGMGEYARKTDEFWISSSKGRYDAKIPFTVEAWLRVQENYNPTVFVNKTPITGEFSYWYDKGTMKLYRCGLNVDVKMKPTQLVLNIMTPYMPITSDGKSPDFSDMNDIIRKTLNTAKVKAKKVYMLEHNSNARNEKEVIMHNIEDAIDKAGSYGKHIFSLRQLYYGIRPYVLDALEKETSYNYFCSIITEYESIYGDIPNMYRDPRGYLYHPHLGQEIPLGTVNVSNYDRPKWTFNKIIYSEKKGLFPQLRNVKFPERFDCALMSSEGFASRAVKDLLDLLGETDEEIHMFCIHDGDASGTLIYETLQEATLARKARKFKIHNLGIEAWEAIDMDLAVENFESKSKRPVAQYVKDRDYESYNENWEEWYQSHRVELNAMTTEQFIEWLEEKLNEFGVGKVIPDEDTLVDNLVENVERLVKEEVKRKILLENGYDDLVRDTIDQKKDKILSQIGNLRCQVEEALDEENENHWTQPIKDIAQSIAK